MLTTAHHYNNDVKQFVSIFDTKKPTRIPSLYPEQYNLLVESTKFLPEDSKPIQRLWYVRHGVSSVRCSSCDSVHFKWNSDTSSPREYCSPKCSNSSTTKKSAVVKSIESKYGTTEAMYKARTDTLYRNNPSLLIKKSVVGDKVGAEERTNRTRATNLVKYGDESYLSSKLDPLIRTKLRSSTYMTHFHITRKLPLSEIARLLGVNITTVSKWVEFHGIDKRLYQGRTSFQETQLADAVARWYPLEIIRSAHILSNNRELDLYFPEHKLAIEYCGLFWHSDNHARIVPSYHADKTKECLAKGIRLITIFEDEWLENPNIVMEKLRTILKQSIRPKVNARDCRVYGPVSSKDRSTFMNANHIQGVDKASYTIGLLFNNQYVAMMSFINKGNNKYELSRYATSANVRGGFTKLLSYFEKTVDWKEIVSFADLRWSQGDIYNNNGFTYVHTAAPVYYYVRRNKRLHRSSYMKQKIAQRHPEIYDSNKTETEMTKMLKLSRIWDCGKKKYAKYRICGKHNL